MATPRDKVVCKTKFARMVSTMMTSNNIQTPSIKNHNVDLLTQRLKGRQQKNMNLFT